MKNNKDFSVHFTLAIQDHNNILSSHEETHSEDVLDLIEDIFYDVDDVKIRSITVKEKT